MTLTRKIKQETASLNKMNMKVMLMNVAEQNKKKRLNLTQHATIADLHATDDPIT